MAARAVFRGVGARWVGAVVRVEAVGERLWVGLRLGFLRDMIRGREERLRGLDLKREDGEMVRWAGR